MEEDINILKFEFHSNLSIFSYFSRSDTDLYFNEHSDELRQGLFYILGFLCFFTSIAFYNVKLIVKILEYPVSKTHFFQLSPGEYFISTLIISFSIGVLFSTPLLLSQLLFFFRPLFFLG
ncbi:unnamed protein product [Ascophyllum nodosum]